MNRKIKITILLATTLVYLISLVLLETHADPVGASVVNISTVTGASSPENRTDEGGTINIINVNVTQQNYAWKAYVGNITATLTLDDGNGYTIYDWSVTQGSLTGEIYASRNSSVLWTGIACASGSTIAAEHTSVNMSPTQGDNINTTFNFNTHPTFVIAGTTLENNTCRSLYTYYNGTNQTDNSSVSKFSEILIQNTNNNLIYVTKLEQDEISYIDNSTTYDFQMIVADDVRSNQQTVYWFYAEIDS